MRPFNPFNVNVTAEEIRNFLRYEFPFVPEAPPRTSRQALQQLAQKWINFHAQAEASKCSQGTGRNAIDIKPDLGHAVLDASKHTDKPKNSSSTRVDQKPRPSGSSSTANVPKSPPLSALDIEINLLADTGDRKSVKSSGRSVSSKSQKDEALSERHGSRAAPISKKKPAPTPKKKPAPTPKNQPLPAPKNAPAPSQTPKNKPAPTPKNKPATGNAITRKSNQIVAVKQPLIPSPINSTFPGSSVQRNSGSKSSQISPCHKRDSDEAFSDAEQDNENILISPKRLKKASLPPTRKKSSIPAPVKKDPIMRSTKSTKSCPPGHASISKIGPSRPRPQVRFLGSDPSPGSETSSLTPLGSSGSSSDVESEDSSVSKAKDSLVASDSSHLVTGTRRPALKNGCGEPSSSKPISSTVPYSTPDDPLPDSTKPCNCECRNEMTGLKSRVEFLEGFLL